MKKVLKWVGVIVGVAVVLLAIAGFVVSSIGKSRARQTFEISASLLSSVSADSASLARGTHLSIIHACQECHGADLSGKIFVDAPPFRVSASNLTSGAGGIGSSYSVEDFDRLIRYGVRPNGQSVIIMPSKTFHNLNDEDTAALIAYLKSVPPVDNELPPTELKTLGTILAGAGAVDLAESVHLEAARPGPVPPGETVDYGKYLTSITCIYCHGADLGGGEALEPGTPAPPALTKAASWPLDQFMSTIRTGVRPDGLPMDPQIMPWTAFRDMTDMELSAIHAYLQTIGG